jgi:hypothetical protein
VFSPAPLKIGGSYARRLLESKDEINPQPGPVERDKLRHIYELVSTEFCSQRYSIPYGFSTSRDTVDTVRMSRLGVGSLETFLDVELVEKTSSVLTRHVRWIRV